MATPYRLFLYQQDLIAELLAVEVRQIAYTLAESNLGYSTVDTLPAMLATKTDFPIVANVQKLPKLRPASRAGPWWKRFEKRRGR